MAFSTINKSTDYQHTHLYTGNGGASHAITGVGFQPDVLWIKCRTGAENHVLVDAVRGDSPDTSGYYELRPDTTQASTSGSYNTIVSAIGADGFTVGVNDIVNTNLQPYTSWNWLANGAGSSNGDGDITSTVSVNTTAGISICKVVKSGTSIETFGHGLGAVPKMIIGKAASQTSNWITYHQAIGNTKAIYLNDNSIQVDSVTFWNDTTPTSSLVTLGSDNAWDGTEMFYCFTDIAGYSKFSSYIGNGNTEGTFVYTGFKPSFVMIKGAISGDGDAAQNWELYDNKREGYNPDNDSLSPSTTGAEGTQNRIDFLSNGFKIIISSDGVNDNNSTYIYAAFGQPIISNSGTCATAR